MIQMGSTIPEVKLRAIQPTQGLKVPGNSLRRAVPVLLLILQPVSHQQVAKPILVDNPEADKVEADPEQVDLVLVGQVAAVPVLAGLVQVALVQVVPAQADQVPAARPHQVARAAITLVPEVQPIKYEHVRINITVT